MHRLRAEGSEFATSAARAFVFDAVVAAPRERVFDAIVADPQTWKAWLPGITDGGYGSAGDHCAGATRLLGLAGIRVRERILVHEEPRHWSYRVDAVSIPIARAIVETWLFEELPDGTHVRWTFAIDPTLLFRLFPLPRTTIGALWRRGMRNLSARLQRAS
jgi:hypothetical protein